MPTAPGRRRPAPCLARRKPVAATSDQSEDPNRGEPENGHGNRIELRNLIGGEFADPADGATEDYTTVKHVMVNLEA